MIGYLKKNFPTTVTSDTVKRYQLASNNESYVINVLQFIGLIDEEGKRTEIGHTVLTTYDTEAFNLAFQDLLKKAYSDLYETWGEDTWSLTREQLIGYFRAADRTSEIIAGRQAGVFIALRGIAGHASPNGNGATAKAPKAPKPSRSASKSKPPTAAVVEVPSSTASQMPANRDMALTVRIEINLPAEGSQETYDYIFKSIKANLLP
jgi:hypothetical protein